MLRSSDRDPQVEFVAGQLIRVHWASGYTFVPGEGYLMEWQPQGSHRLMLLQIALKKNRVALHGLDRIDVDDEESNEAIRDFWNACVTQLALKNEKDSLRAFVKIIESWTPRSRE